MIAGARAGTVSGLRRLTAAAMARDLHAIIVPGPEVARARGLDIESAGLQIAATPRHANVLLLVGPVPRELGDAVIVLYAQMMRPRAIFSLGASATPSPLPHADVTADLSQSGLLDGVTRLRSAFSRGAFRLGVSDFDAPALQIRIEYTCPMHPEVVQDQPGSCPKCGMNLVPREASASAEPHHGAEHATPPEYTCPMHPEIVQGEPGSCPKCGMNLVPREAGSADEHAQGHQDADMDHGDMGFMSMVEVTKDLPRSPDGLPMDWIEVPFGPFFPGLPGGLLLTLTLDGDGIAKARAQSLVGGSGALPASGMGAADFVEHLSASDPLAPICYRLLACRTLEAAAGQAPDEEILRGRIAAMERERIASHLGWLALFARQIGFGWLLRRAASLQLQFLHADIKQVMALSPALQALIKRLQRTPLLKSRTAGIGRMVPDTVLRGPVARATGVGDDARSRDKTCSTLGFTAVSRDRGDALARLHVRLDETRHSLALIKAAGAIVLPTPVDIGVISGKGEAAVETPRGEARLQLTLDNGRVIDARLDTPSTHHLDLVAPLLEQQELGDGLTTVASLDLSPWEVVQ